VYLRVPLCKQGVTGSIPVRSIHQAPEGCVLTTNNPFFNTPITNSQNEHPAHHLHTGTSWLVRYTQWPVFEDSEEARLRVPTPMSH